MDKNSSLVLAKEPCVHKVKIGRKSFKCLDVWRIIERDEKGKVRSIKCYTHHHVSRGKERILAS